MRYSKILLVLAGFALNSWGQVRVSVEVPANRAWTRTGVFLDQGSTVLIEATGLIEAVPPADTRPLFHRVPPEGRAERQENKPQPTMRALVMLGRIGNGPVFEAGARTELTADRSGELQLGINDNNVEDNTGSWSAQITVRGGTTTSQQRGTGRSQDNTAPGGAPSQTAGRYQNDPETRGGAATAQERTDRYQDNSSVRNDPSQQRGSAPNAGTSSGNPPNYQDQDQRRTNNPPYGNPDRYRSEDQYRPDYRGSDYYRRYGHGFGVEAAVRMCQQTVLTQASRRFRNPDVHFHRTAIDDSPGRDDWVTGTFDIHRGARVERFGFSCSVNFDTGRMRSAEIDPRPLPDNPRRR